MSTKDRNSHSVTMCNISRFCLKHNFDRDVNTKYIQGNISRRKSFYRGEAPRGTQERCVWGYSGEVSRVFRGFHFSGVFRGFQGYSGEVFRVFRVFRPLILGFSAGNSGGTSPLSDLLKVTNDSQQLIRDQCHNTCNIANNNDFL